MHVYMFSEGELLAITSLTGLVAWLSSRFWSARRSPRGTQSAFRGAPGDLNAIQEENQRLRRQIEKQEGRIRSLEAIATDPALRTAREIEELRTAR